MQRFWVSWYQPTEDFRPLTYPPNPGILGWWCSGVRGDNNNAILCALVSAENEDTARAAVIRDWPEAGEWRFFEQVTSNWQPVIGRFVREPWMLERMG